MRLDATRASGNVSVSITVNFKIKSIRINVVV